MSLVKNICTMYNLHPPILALHVVSLFSLFRAENLLTVKLYEIKPNLILFLPRLAHICIANCAKVVHGQCPNSD